MTAPLQPQPLRPPGADSIGIDAVAYWLPSDTMTLHELGARGLLQSPPQLLEEFGFARVHVSGDVVPADMALCAARTLLRENAVDPEEIDLLLYAGGLASSGTLAGHEAAGRALFELRQVMDFFKYPASYLQSELSLTRASVAGVDQLGCASIFAALRLGRAMMLADGDVNAVLCVGADRLPPGAPREMVYNVISDAGCAALLRRNARRNTIVATGHITKGAYWDAQSLEHEVVAAYFPTARTMILDTLRKAGLSLDDIAWIIPHNVSRRSWEIMLGVLGSPVAKLYADNIARVGHTIAADNLINLRDATDAGVLRPGDYLLLFTFGFGLNWSCMILQH